MKWLNKKLGQLEHLDILADKWAQDSRQASMRGQNAKLRALWHRREELVRRLFSIGYTSTSSGSGRFYYPKQDGVGAYASRIFLKLGGSKHYWRM